MKIILYFSKNSKIREIGNKQLTLIITGVGLVFSLLLITTFTLLIKDVSNPLIKENHQLKQTIEELSEKLDYIQKSLSEIHNSEKKLQLAAGVYLDDDYAIGGSEENLISLKKDDLNLKTLNKLTEELIDRINYQKEKFEFLLSKFEEKKELARRIPAISPMNGVYSDHSFGIRIHPILKRWRMHEGIDILGQYGEPVLATGAGVVKFVGWNGGLGLCVIIDHGYGYETTYGHLSKASVREGQSVVRFQKIGECGSTGLSTGPHLHYEVSFNGEKQNPIYYILK